MKENKKKVIMYTTLGIIALGIVALTITYAYWRLTREQTKHNEISTGCFNIDFAGENDITLDKAYPMKPEELENFLSKATPYHFTIENTCDDLATATINLESINAEAEKQLNDEYIDAILYETDYHTNLNSEKKLNESMYNDENKVISSSLHAYKLYNFVLQKGETKSFNLLLYMDPDTPMVTANMNASWKGKITLSTEYKEELNANLYGLKVPVVESGDGLYAVSHNVSEISSDWNKTEYRYAGTNVNNYVSFNNEKWRIIGLVNVQTDSGIEQRIKIIRKDDVIYQSDLDKYSWDNGEYTFNNNWTDSKLKDMLNGIYYESGTGECYMVNIGSSTQANKTTCNFSFKGLKDQARTMIDKDVIWNIGGWNTSDITSTQIYEYERGTSTAEDFPAEWNSETDVGEKYNGIGLMYPSDYGYAVGGEVRNNCLAKSLYDFNEDNCATNDWLKSKYGTAWTLSPSSSGPATAFSIYSSGNVVSFEGTLIANVVWPTLYLKPTVKITSNPNSEQEYGTIDNPFVLSM